MPPRGKEGDGGRSMRKRALRWLGDELPGGLQHVLEDLVNGTVDAAPASVLVSASAELLGEFTNVDVATRAKADLDGSVFGGLTHEDRDERARDLKTVVH